MKRLLWIGGLLAGVSLVAGSTWVVAAQVLRSPAEFAAEAEAPEAGPVTAPVERRTLEAEVIVRGTVQYDEPTRVSLSGTPAVDGEAVVTWLPEPGDEAGDGEVLLEASGRPVFTVEGALPAYRDLRPGMSGDDVEQLQESLERLGHSIGEIDGQFGSATEDAVSAWYEEAGYEAPRPSQDELERVRSAEEQVSTARDQLRQAEQQLEEAASGPSRTEILQAESRVSDAREQVEQAEPDTSEARRAGDELAIAEASLEELLADPDTSSQERAVADAQEALDEATRRLGELESETGVWVPAGEVVYIAELPQRIDAVTAELGDSASGELLTMTSSEVVVETSVPAQDFHLVSEGDEVLVGEAEDGFTGTITELAPRPGTDGAGDDRHFMLVDPGEAGEDVVDASLRIQIPVESTDGDVLAVPLAGVSAGGDGSSRVEVVEEAGGGEGPGTRLVTVETGLSTDGVVEVAPVDGDLEEGDQVVVGHADDDGGQGDSDAEDEG